MSAAAWLTASDLAGLSGLPGKRSGVHRMAAREQWACKEEQGNGGTVRLYSVDSLPPEARAELERRRREAERVVQGATEEHYRQLREEQIARSLAMPPWAQTRAAARAAVLAARDTYALACQLNKASINRAFAAAFNAGRIVVPGIEAARIGRLSERTLFRWESAAEVGGRALAGGFGAKGGKSIIDSRPEVVTAILSILADKPWIQQARIYELLCASFPGFREFASESTVSRWMATWRERNPAVWEQMCNPDAAKSRFQVAFGSRSESIVRLNQRWELDSSPADLLLEDGRHTLIACVDVYSRRARIIVAKSSTAHAVGSVLRRSILDWGVPEEILTDNGKDYTAAYIESLCRALEIGHPLCQPFHGEQKPHVERFFRTAQHDLVELLPGYAGHNVAQAQGIRSRKTFAKRLGETEREAFEVALSAEELQLRLNRWLPVYETQPHEGLGGETPASVASKWTQPVRRVGLEAALDILLAPLAGGRTVRKKGISVDSAYYIHGDLGDRVGQRVQVRLDPADLGRIWVFDADGSRICTAECPERTGISRAEVTAQARVRQKASEKQARELLKAAKKAHHIDDIAEAILEERRRQAAKVVELHPATPPEPEIYSTPALEAAAEVLASQQQRSAPVPEEVLERGRAVIRSMDAARAAREAAEAKAADEDAAFIARWVDLADGGLQSASEFDKAWFERMAARDPKIRAWVLLKRPDLQPLLARAEAARR